MDTKKQIRRYWLRDLNTDRKEQTAVTKSFENAVEDMSSVFGVSKSEMRMKILKKGVVESKFQAWVLLSESCENPFDYSAKKTPL